MPGVGSTRSSGLSGPGRQPVSSSTSLAAASKPGSPASALPIGISHPQVPVMKRCRHSSKARPSWSGQADRASIPGAVRISRCSRWRPSGSSTSATRMSSHGSV